MNQTDMPTITALYDQDMATIATDALVFFLKQDFSFDQQLQQVAKTYFPSLQEFFAAEEFTGKQDQVLVLPVQSASIRFLIFTGLGKADTNFAIETYRRAIGSLLKQMQKKKVNNVSLVLPEATLFAVTPCYLAQQTAIISYMALYVFDEFLSEQQAKCKKDIVITLLAKKSEHDAIQTGIETGTIIGQAINRVRHWIDMPPSLLTPVELADKAQAIAKTFGLPITIFSEQEIQKMGMGGLAGVSSGSDQDCKLVILEYKTEHKNAPTIAFVGKGITFDSGGLSIKPSEGMETMKEDMSGAAAVLGAMQAIAQLKPAVNVIGITPLSENMPSGKAVKPGDIVRFYNGKTGEILNTDAEGRLILADALAYAVKHYKPDAIVDIATLTGLCHYFFGPFYTALYSNNQALTKKIQDAAACAGERVWLLPHDQDYKQAVKSKIADVKNVGSKVIKSGTITAAWFLEHFVDDTAWAHLDIAGTAFNVPLSYFNEGATGAGVRLLVELAMQWQD